MRSLFHNTLRIARSARDDLFIVWLALSAFLIGGCTATGESVDVARGALALAKAQREREATTCFSDFEDARKASRQLGKPLVLWVGVNCSDHPRLRQELSNAIHCHLREQNDDRSPRVVIEGSDGKEWFVRPDQIGPDTVKRIRDKWR